MENYNPSIKLVGGLGQANDRDFYLMNTDQIQADKEGTSLTEKLNTIASSGGKTYTAGMGISISSNNEVSVNRDDLNIPAAYNDSDLKQKVEKNSSDINTLQAKVSEQTGLIGKYEGTLRWIIEEYDPSKTVEEDV